MTERSLPLFAPDFQQLRIVVVGYAMGLFVAATVIEIILLGFTLLIAPSLAICVSTALVGVIIVTFEEVDFHRRLKTTLPPSPPPSPPILVRVLIMLVLVVGIIVGAFAYSHTHQSASLALVAGIASALTCGLSVVGALIWNNLGVVSSVYWSSWFNLFAAAFASLAVGYAPG